MLCDAGTEWGAIRGRDMTEHVLDVRGIFRSRRRSFGRPRCAPTAFPESATSDQRPRTRSTSERRFSTGVAGFVPPARH